MMACHRSAWILCFSLFLAAGSSLAAVPDAEDLSGCKLPNGQVTLALDGTPQAAKGALFKFSTGAFIPYPTGSDGRVLPPDQALAKVRDLRAADLEYLSEQDGSLWAFSGRISELGVSFLTEQAGKKLDLPGELPKTSISRAGLMWGVMEGHVYLLQTTDQKFALLRVLEKTKTAIVFQYVYQTDGTTAFDIPEHPTVSYVRPPELQGPGAAASAPAEAVSPPATRTAIAESPVVSPLSPAPRATTFPAAPRPELGPDDYVAPGYIILGPGPRNTVTGLTPSFSAFLEQRGKLIEARVQTVRAPARTNDEIDAKSHAISELAMLHADETVDLLVSQINFLDARGNAREFSVDAFHPCVAALKHLGKSGSDAALKALGQLDLQGPGEGIDSDMYKAGLLGEVIRSVEGDDVAALLYRRELDRQSEPKHRAVFEYLLSRLAPHP